MSSTPDYERAHQLNPDKFPKDPSARARELEAQNAFLADELAKHTKKTRTQILSDAAKAVSDNTVTKLPERKAVASVKKEEVVIGRDDAAFFANTEGSTFAPLNELGDDEDNLIFFKTSEEAEEKGYTLRLIEEDKPKKTAKKGK